MESILGGGSSLLPGEVSLSHNGYLLLDELPEFKSSILQSLREPMEEGIVRINRVKGSVWYPSKFQVIATANPCPCGNLGKENSVCLCSEREIRNYWKRVGGAIMDRVDIRIPVNKTPTKYLLKKSSYTSKLMVKRIGTAIKMQKKRFENTNISNNGDIPPGLINTYCRLNKSDMEYFIKGVENLSISSRGSHSILKLSRTIADLDGSDTLEREHISRAFSYRRYGDGDYFF